MFPHHHHHLDFDAPAVGSEVLTPVLIVGMYACRIAGHRQHTSFPFSKIPRPSMIWPSCPGVLTDPPEFLLSFFRSEHHPIL
jgi:hypothetical protein